MLTGNVHNILRSNYESCPSVSLSVPSGLITLKQKGMKKPSWPQRPPKQEWSMCQFSAWKVKGQGHRTQKREENDANLVQYGKTQLDLIHCERLQR